MDTTDFESFLKQENFAHNTVKAYLYAVKDYFTHYKELNKRNLIAYKNHLTDNFSQRQITSAYWGDKYLGYIGKSRLRWKTIKTATYLS